MIEIRRNNKTRMWETLNTDTQIYANLTEIVPVQAISKNKDLLMRNGNAFAKRRHKLYVVLNANGKVVEVKDYRPQDAQRRNPPPKLDPNP